METIQILAGWPDSARTSATLHISCKLRQTASISTVTIPPMITVSWLSFDITLNLYSHVL